MSRDENAAVATSGEMSELQEVAASRFFARSPNLTCILQYLCRTVLEGNAAEIKEYNVAVQALGRDSSFDPSRDSIVRVEISRLRKRLKQYYLTEGASHAIQIQLPESGYVPRFVNVGNAAEVQVAEPESVPPSVAPPGEPSAPESPGKKRIGWITAVAGIVAICFLATLYLWNKRNSTAKNPAATPAATGASSPAIAETDVSSGIRVAVASSMPKYEDSLSRVWTGDHDVKGGEMVHRPDRRIYRTLDPALYQNARVGDFQYDIPLKPGIYELHLYFAEILHIDTIDSGAEALRRFNISLNGKPLLLGFDIVLDTGGMLNTADEKVFTDVSPANDGKLHLRFWASNDQAVLSGIEIVPATSPKMRPVRILAGPRTAYDHRQKFWGADRYFLGGRVIERTQGASRTSDPELFTSERFGNFTYDIPVAPGEYTATMYFAESNFGVDNFGAAGYAHGAKGSREFDIFCNGVALIRNFDILGEAGGPNQAVIKTFRHLRPNAQGKLDLSFVPDVDYATVRAIEVTPE